MKRVKLEASINDALSKGLFRQARLLIDLEYDVNTRNTRSQTAIMTCALVDHKLWSLSVATALLQTQRVNLDARDFVGFTALHHACAYERHDLALMLLQHKGFDTQALDIFCNRPCHYAAANGNALIMQALLRHQMKVQLNISCFMTANVAGHTPISLAKLCGNTDCFVLLRDATGDIKFPSKEDLLLSRQMTDVTFSLDQTLQSVAIDDKFFIKHHPTFKMRKKVRGISGKLALHEGGHHYDDEVCSDKMPKHAMHYAFDLCHWCCADIARVVEKEVRVVEEEVRVVEEEVRGVEKEVRVVEEEVRVVEKEEDGLVKVGSEMTNKNASNGVNEGSGVERNVDDKDDDGEDDGEDEVSSDERAEVDYRKICKSYRVEEVVLKCEGEDDDEEDDEEEDDEEEDENKREKSNETSSKECVENGMVVMVTEHFKPPLPSPLLLPHHNTCIQDRNFSRCSCKVKAGVRTNVERGVGRKLKGFVWAVLHELLLPVNERSPPLSPKLQALVEGVLRKGVVDRRVFKELRVARWEEEKEGKMSKLYEDEGQRLQYKRSVYTYPACKLESMYTFSTCMLQPKAMQQNVCCVDASCILPRPLAPIPKPTPLQGTLTFIDDLYSNQASYAYKEPFALPQVLVRQEVAARDES